MEGAAFYLCGATGVGKTEVAIALAERLGGEIVGADAMQVYTGVPVLSAQPGAEEMARVPHHCIGFVPVGESWDVALHVERARAVIAEIRGRGRLPIVCGGTGLYVRGLMRGLADLPRADATLRSELEGCPLGELAARLVALDPAAAFRVDLHNPRRVLRALEVCLLTGRPFTATQEQWHGAPGEIRGIVLCRGREDLHARIERRVAVMLTSGAIEEVWAMPEASATARQMIGVREIEELLSGKIDRSECAVRTAQRTRALAKRQATWFRREPALAEVQAGIPGLLDTLARLACP